MNLIVAVDRNYGIGSNNDLLFNLKLDMKYFREKTTNKIVVMGDRTLLSFPNAKPLKNRINIVISADKNFQVEGAIVVHNLKELFIELRKYNSKDIFVIGGAFIYNTLFPYCKTAYITKIDAERPADRSIIKIEELPNWYLKSESETYTEGETDFKFCEFENLSPIEFNYNSNLHFESIETENLIIRKIRDTDFEDWYEFVSDEETVKFLAFPVYTDKKTIKERYNYVTHCYENTDNLDYFIELKDSHKMIGTISINGYKNTACGKLEIGYMLNRNYWKNGYMTEALGGMIKYLFENTTVNRIQLKHDIDNPASGRVMQKNNLKLEGIIRQSSQSNHNEKADMALYSITREEYLNNKNN